jgi:hypothetical protein
MYIVINRTKRTETKYKGSFPYSLLVDLLENGDDLIVISTYSNTIKVPYYIEHNGVKEWEWESFPFK